MSKTLEWIINSASSMASPFTSIVEKYEENGSIYFIGAGVIFLFFIALFGIPIYFLLRYYGYF